jgi:molybdate transport system substrate-binding protein
VFSAGIAVTTRDAELARSVIEFLASPDAASAITKSGLEPVRDD